jgi:hypothetical protein
MKPARRKNRHELLHGAKLDLQLAAQDIATTIQDADALNESHRAKVRKGMDKMLSALIAYEEALK